MTERVTPYDDLVNVPRKGSALLVQGGRAAVHQTDLSDFDYDTITLVCVGSSADVFLPRVIRRRLGSPPPTFTDCVFDGLSCRWLDLGHARFVRCSFDNVRVKAASPVTAHFLDCNFSGIWEGNFSAEASSGDVVSRVTFLGNKLTNLYGADFEGGISLHENDILRDDGTQLVVTTTSPWLPEAYAAAVGDSFTSNRLSSLIGRGPLYIGQDWLILHQDETDEAVWNRLKTLSANK